MGRSKSTRRQLLWAVGLPLVGGITGCSELREFRNDTRDTDGDGVIDSEDYAPRDPEVQEKSDLVGTDSPTSSGENQGTAATQDTEELLSSLPVDVLLTFDDGIEDVSGNDRDVSVTGGELVERISGQALRLSPPDAYFTVETGLESPGFDSGEDAQPFSYATWVKIHSERQHEIFTNEGSRRRLAINADRQVCGRMWGAEGSVEGQPTCSATVPLDEWVHVGFVFTGTEGRVYYDGDQVGSSPWKGYTGDAKTCSGSRAKGGGDCEAAPGRIDATIDQWMVISTDVGPETMRKLATR